MCIYVHVKVERICNFYFLIFSFKSISIGDASSPHGATCIQFNGGEPSSPSSPAGAGNEGLTRQQLDLISQIMQQTKQANAGITAANGQRQTQRPRTWNMQVGKTSNKKKEMKSISSSLVDFFFPFSSFKTLILPIRFAYIIMINFFFLLFQLN